MGEIVLVRHGQANSGATTEADYDRLSPLGHQQAQWLGDWMRGNEAPFDHLFSGTLRRHRETAANMAIGTPDEDARLNELDYFALARDIEVTRGLPLPQGDNWADHMSETFVAWHAAEIAGTEPYSHFAARVRDVLAEAAKPGIRVCCVTSGGVIAMAFCHALGLSADRLAQVVLPIANSSITRFRVRDTGTFLSAYNAVPHLDAPDRATARTWL